MSSRYKYILISNILQKEFKLQVRHAAVPRPVGTGGSGGPAPPRNDSDQWPDGESVQARYEYFVEHAISTSDAKKMAIMLKLSESK